MAYSKKVTKADGWKAVKELSGVTVIGTKERFSISLEVCEGFRIGINGCRVASGSKGEFISYPAWKDKQGNYHNYCYMTFQPDEVDAIISTLE